MTTNHKLPRRSIYYILTLAALGQFASNQAVAEPMLHTPSFYRTGDMSRYVDNYVEVGAGYNSKDSYKFGEWNGLRESGAYPIVGFNWLSRSLDDDASYWRVNGQGLGLESRKLGVEAGRQGHWRLNASADRLVRSELDSARFIYPNGLGTNSIGGLTSTVSASTPLTPYKVEQGRDFYRLGMNTVLSPNWEFSVNYREDVRDGARVMGVLFSVGGFAAFRGINVPYEIDDHTQQVDVALGFADKTSQLQFAYHYSRYENDLDAFNIAENPSSLTNSGRISLMPSNEYHQFTATGMHRFTRDTRVTAKLSYGLGTQDDRFLPYTTGSASIALPRTSLDGELHRTLFDLTLTTQPTEASNLKLGYQYFDHDNQTPIADYLYAGRDGAQPASATNSSNARRNVPISTTEHKVVVDGDYRLTQKTVLRGVVEYSEKEYTLTDRKETETVQAGLELRRPVLETVSGSLGYTYTERTGSAYDKNTFFRESYYDPTFQTNTRLNAHPSLRSFLYADYAQNKLKAGANWTATETLSVQGSVDGYVQEFNGPDCATIVDPLAAAGISGAVPDTCLGRNEASGTTASLDLQWQPEEFLTAYSFYTYSELETKQRGRVWTRPTNGTAPNTSGALTANDWFATLNQQDNTVGVGFKWQAIEDILDVGGHYVYGDGRLTTEFASGSNIATTPVPEVKTTSHAVQLYGKWAYNRKVTVRLNYLYEQMKVDDWAYANAATGGTLGALDSVGTLVWTGQSAPKYENHVIGVSVAVHSW